MAFHWEWSLPTTLQQEVPASCVQPIKTQYSAMKVPLRKSHVPLSALDSSQDRLCFFLPVNARNTLRSSAGATTQANNVRMDQAIVSQGSSLRNVRLCRLVSGRDVGPELASKFT